MTVLYRIDASANMYRYYAVTLTPNLFGEMTLVREWGRLGRRGQIRSETYDRADTAADARGRIIARKMRRGYCVEEPVTLR